MMRRIATSLLISVLLIGGAVPQVNAQTSKAVAVQSDYAKHWAKAEIDWAIQKHLMWKNPDGTFKPDETITQGQFLTTLTATLGVSARSPFPQTAKSWANATYEKANKAGWITPDIKIDPNAKITRFEAAKWIMNAWGHKQVKDPIYYCYLRSSLFASHKFVNGFYNTKGLEAYRDYHYFFKTALPTDKFTRAETANTMKLLAFKWGQTQQAIKIKDEFQKSLYIKNGMVYGKIPNIPFIKYELEAGFLYFDEKGNYVKELKGNFSVPAKGNITFRYTNRNSTTAWYGWNLPNLTPIDTGSKFFAGERL